MIRFLVALLVLLAAPAFATQERWPALFDVAGVAANDVLNVRAAPDAGAEKIGELAPDARGVEVIAADARQNWGQVNVNGQTGWASLHYLRRQPGQWLGSTIETVRCFGTEPFWSVTRSVDAISWSMPEGRPDGTVQSDLASLARRDVSGLIYRLTDGMRGHLLMTLDSCSDGMSNYTYGIGAAVTHDLDGTPELLAGCCSLDVD
ncbi:SH3 domain-containing protein [Citreimonas salinaria]|uniref:SH3 domain-containing protein n=1 Tax=Citreimonas salinaria TaxID=321339 RepID=A0A1H3LUL8_9RHOB|nr:SH3 domain-containing protein [Citreimonas salinaria]SDY68050.1 SH3 domain-containing protein [Citreimonas salinaria]